MASIDEKFRRLSPDQQRVVEDFITFLLERGGSNEPSPHPSPREAAFEEVGSSSFPLGGLAPARKDDDILGDYPVYGGDAPPEEDPSPPRRPSRRGQDTEPILEWID